MSSIRATSRNNISTYFKSIGLKSSPNNPCVFHGSLLPNSPPLTVGLYVDDFCFIRERYDVEKKFRDFMNLKYSVTFDDTIEWLFGMKFQWKSKQDSLKCHVHQEEFALDLIEQHGLSDCNK